MFLVFIIHIVLISIILHTQPPTFDPSTTDDPNFYVVEFSRQDGTGLITRNVPASTDPLMITYDDLMKGTSYRARIVAYNDRGVGILSDFFTAQTNIDRELFYYLNYITVAILKVS